MTTGAAARLDIPALLAELTLEEKASLLDGSDFWHTQPIERLGIPALMVTDGPHGLRKQADDADHLGLNRSVPATCFPPAVGLASSWDAGLLRRVGAALGVETRAADVAVLLGPGVNMKRSPLCGRNFEYFSEDPLLAGELAAALVDGMQGEGVGASLKHFAANNQETDRMTVSADVDERTLREIYLTAFELVVTRAQPWTVMSSYNRINGEYVSDSRWLLTDILRGDWGFDGLVMSDWGGTSRRDVGVAAGLDLEMPSSGGGGTRIILDAVRAGTLSEADVDRAVTRVLTLVDRALQGAGGERGFDIAAHHALAREAAAASAVLLKNDGGLLPLDPDAGGTVAVIGEFARTPRYQGAGSSQVNPTQLDSALDALRAALEGRREVAFAPGFAIESEAGDPALVERGGPDRGVRRRGRAVPRPAARVRVGGLRPRAHGPARAPGRAPARGGRRQPARRRRALQRLGRHRRAVAGPRCSRPRGLAARPGRRLRHRRPAARRGEPVRASWPRPSRVRYEDNPTIGAFPGEHGHVRYGEGLLIGYRWYDAHRLPVAYPFGHGLSYTTFAYDDLAATVRADGEEPEVEVDAHRHQHRRARRHGDRPGLRRPTRRRPSTGPEQELRAFARVALGPGESAAVASPSARGPSRSGTCPQRAGWSRAARSACASAPLRATSGSRPRSSSPVATSRWRSPRSPRRTRGSRTTRPAPWLREVLGDLRVRRHAVRPAARPDDARDPAAAALAHAGLPRVGAGGRRGRRPLRRRLTHSAGRR